MFPSSAKKKGTGVDRVQTVVPMGFQMLKPTAESEQASQPQIEQREISQEQISLRAFGIYQSGGCVDGRDSEDWLQAEREMLLPLRK